MNQVALGVIYIGNISQKKVPKTFCQDSKTHKGKPYMQDESTNINLKHLLLSPDLLDHQCFIHRDFVEQTSQILYMQTQKKTHTSPKKTYSQKTTTWKTPRPQVIEVWCRCSFPFRGSNSIDQWGKCETTF